MAALRFFFYDFRFSISNLRFQILFNVRYSFHQFIPHPLSFIPQFLSSSLHHFINLPLIYKQVAPNGAQRIFYYCFSTNRSHLTVLFLSLIPHPTCYSLLDTCYLLLVTELSIPTSFVVGTSLCVALSTHFNFQLFWRSLIGVRHSNLSPLFIKKFDIGTLLSWKRVLHLLIPKYHI